MANNPTQTALGQTTPALSARDKAFQDGVQTIVNGSGTDADKLVAAETLMFSTYGTNLTSESQQATIAGLKKEIDLHGEAIIVGQEPDIVVTSSPLTEIKPTNDPRVRLSAFKNKEEQIYGKNDPSSNILYRLWDTGGLLFPYTPAISVSQDTSWQSVDIQQSNFDILSYQKSASASISLTARFTVQNQREGEYLLAAIHFLRTVSKTYFGETSADTFLDGKSEVNDQPKKIRQAGNSGLPPPVLILSGYGELMFNEVRCVVKSHSWAFDENADMVEVSVLGGKTSVWLPPILQISIGLGIQMSGDDVRTVFNLDTFRTGQLLLGNKKGWF